MKTSMLIRWSGLAAILGGLLFGALGRLPRLVTELLETPRTETVAGRPHAP